MMRMGCETEEIEERRSKEDSERKMERRWEGTWWSTRKGWQVTKANEGERWTTYTNSNIGIGADFPYIGES